jgi:hypothetical protein
MHVLTARDISLPHRTHHSVPGTLGISMLTRLRALFHSTTGSLRQSRCVCLSTCTLRFLWCGVVVLLLVH